MMDGIANKVMYQTATRGMTDLRSRMAELQQEVSSGKKADLAISEPTAARQALGLRHEVENINEQVATADNVLNRTKAVQQSFDTVRGVAKEARNAMVDAPVGDTTEGLGLAGNQAKSAAKQILSTLNMDVGGQYLFSGTKTDTPPFKDNIGEVKPSVDGNNDTALGMVEERLTHMARNDLANTAINDFAASGDKEANPDRQAIDTKTDAIRAVSQATVTIMTDPGNIEVNDNKVRLKDSNGNVIDTVGEVHVETLDTKAGTEDNQKDSFKQAVTIAFDRDFDPSQFASNGKDERVSVNLNGTEFTSDKIKNLSNAHAGGVAESLKSNIQSNNTWSFTPDFGTTKGGIDAAFRDRADLISDTSGGSNPRTYGDTSNSTGVLYQGNDESLTTRVNGKDISYSKTAGSNAVRDIMEGLLLEAAADRMKGERAAGIARQEDRQVDEPGEDKNIPGENQGVNELRRQAMERVTAGLDKLDRLQGEVGVARQEIETAKESLETSKQVAEKQLNDLENVDKAAAVTKLQNVQTRLQASYKTTSQIQQMSLAKYI